MRALFTLHWPSNILNCWHRTHKLFLSSLVRLAMNSKLLLKPSLKQLRWIRIKLSPFQHRLVSSIQLLSRSLWSPNQLLQLCNRWQHWWLPIIIPTQNRAPFQMQQLITIQPKFYHNHQQHQHHHHHHHHPHLYQHHHGLIHPLRQHRVIPLPLVASISPNL